MKFSRITGHFGAAVSGVNLDKDYSAEMVDEIRQGLLDHKVLIFNEQGDLTPASHVRLAQAFGPLNTHPFHPQVEGQTGIDLLRSKGTSAREGWHTDLGFEKPHNLVTMLRAIEVPEYGRDTGFCDVEAVYEGLSPAMKDFVENLVGIRDWRHIFRPQSQFPEDGENRQASSHRGFVVISDEEYEYRDKHMPALDVPVVSTNPETGRKALMVDTTFTTGIKNLREVESETILRMLFNELHYPEYQLRASWKPGTLVMWDNRTTLHAMIFDSMFPRTMHRTIAKGDRLFAEKARVDKAA